MSGIRTTIEIEDKISLQLNKIQDMLDSTTSAFNKADIASDRCFDSLETAKTVADLNRIEDNVEDVTDELNKATKEAMGFCDVFSYLGGLGIAYFIQDEVSKAIDYASDLTEVQNVVDVSFGLATEKVNDWSKTTLEAYGINELSAKRYAGTMGAMLKSSGLASEAVTDMSTKIAALSGDMASFYNLSSDAAFYKIRAGISGETEPLKELGINMSVANLEAYALSQGITESYNSMSQAEQTLLRYNYLLSVTTDAQGDFARTSDSYANQTRLFGENVREFLGSIAEGALPMLTSVMMSLNTGVAMVRDNWSVLSPLLVGALAVLGALSVAWGVNKVQMTWNAIALSAQTAGTILYTASAVSAAFAQGGLNAAFAACPITWIVVGVIALVAVMYALAQAIANNVEGVETGFGIIMGVVATAGAFIFNTVVGTLNGILQLMYSMFLYPAIAVIEFFLNVMNGGFDSFGDACANLIGQITGWFLNLGMVVTKIIDAIFGSDWTSGLNNLRDNVLAWGKNNNAITFDKEVNGVARIDYGDAWNAGTAWGDGVSSDISGMITPQSGNLPVIDTTGAQIAANTGDTAKNVGKLSEGVDITNEQLRYMRDVAEREVINRYTLSEIKVDMTNNNTISNGLDIDGVVERLRDGVNEAMMLNAEGVH